MLTFAKRLDGSIISIDELEGVPRRERPRCICYGCDAGLTPKLGQQVAHHFAHQPDSPCYAAGTGEGAMHLAAKLHLARELLRLAQARGGFVDAVVKCVNCESLVPPAKLCEVVPGDELLVEKKLHEFKPDVQLQRGGQVVAVFEIVCTNPCSDEKWARLKEERTASVVECAASALLDRQIDFRWTPSGPLEAIRAIRVAASKLCVSCEDEVRRKQLEAAKAQEEAKARAARAAEEVVRAKQQRAAARRAEIAEQWDKWNKAPQHRVLLICDADLFFSDGRRSAHLLMVTRTFLCGECRSGELTIDGQTRRDWNWDAATAADPDKLRRRADEAADDWVESLGRPESETYGSFFDPRILMYPKALWPNAPSRVAFGSREIEEEPDPERPPTIDVGVKEDPVWHLPRPRSFRRWYAAEKCWIECYTFDEMTALFSGLADKYDIMKWMHYGPTKAINVQEDRYAGVFKASERDKVDKFRDSLRERATEWQAPCFGSAIEPWLVRRRDRPPGRRR